MKVAVFGLGSMGYGIAQSLLRAGLTTHGYDVSQAPMDRFIGEGGAKGEPVEIAATLDAAVIVVLNAQQTRDVLFSKPGIVPRLREGAVIIGCATVPPAFAREMEEACGEHGVRYLDAPISGGAAKSAQGRLSVMASGSPEAFAAARPVLDAISETVFELGDAAGAGSGMKAVNQLLAGVHIAAMAEAMTFGMTQGIAPERFMDVIPRCAGTSWMLENRGPHIVDGDYAPRSSVDIWPKDLGIVMEAARIAGFEAPLAATALERFEAASKAGLGRQDDAALAKIYAAQAGLPLPEPGESGPDGSAA